MQVSLVTCHLSLGTTMTNRRRLVIWADLLLARHTTSALFLMRWVTLGMLSTLETLTAGGGMRPRCGFARG